MKIEALRKVYFWDNQEKDKELSLEEVEEKVKARENYKNWAL